MRGTTEGRAQTGRTRRPRSQRARRETSPARAGSRSHLPHRLPRTMARATRMEGTARGLPRLPRATTRASRQSRRKRSTIKSTSTATTTMTMMTEIEDDCRGSGLLARASLTTITTSRSRETGGTTRLTSTVLSRKVPQKTRGELLAARETTRFARRTSCLLPSSPHPPSRSKSVAGASPRKSWTPSKEKSTAQPTTRSTPSTPNTTTIAHRLPADLFPLLRLLPPPLPWTPRRLGSPRGRKPSSRAARTFIVHPRRFQLPTLLPPAVARAEPVQPRTRLRTISTSTTRPRRASRL